MACEQCERRKRMFLEAMIEEDRAEHALRSFFLTHLKLAGVSDLDEYAALRTQQQKAEETRHRAFLDAVEHRKQHGPGVNSETVEEVLA